MSENSTESRQERFIRVASKRTDELIDKIRILGNCSNKSSYEYTDDQVSKIFSAIEKELIATKTKFRKGKKQRFRL